MAFAMLLSWLDEESDEQDGQANAGADFDSQVLTGWYFKGVDPFEHFALSPKSIYESDYTPGG